MKRISILLVFLALVFCFAKSSFAFELNLPEPYGYVNDYAKVMSPSKREALEQELTAFAQKNQKEVYVVVVDRLQGVIINNYATKLFEKWRVGKRGLDEGALILISSSDRKVIIESGYLVRNTALADDVKSVVDQVMLPEFTKGNYDSGISEGASMMMKIVNGEQVFLIKKIFTINTGIVILILVTTIYLIYSFFPHYRKKKT